MAERRLIGVLGGMGPLATVDFMQKVIEATPAIHDQDHVPLIVYSVPQIPDRVGAAVAGTDEPLPAMLTGIKTLEQAGVEAIAIACNTAHAWYDQLAASTKVPIIHMAQAVIDAASQDTGPIAVLATVGTLRAGIYQRYFEKAGWQALVPEGQDQAHIVDAIAAVKCGEIERARASFDTAAAGLLALGAGRLLLACTELPVAAKGSIHETRCLDATACLARASVEFACRLQQ
ncbi:amino acid racemase [Rhabdaerophilum sp. SD176]|uniref:aspartate/glutamate racemase family protein n=1 Tax=Rhabdaerophilum sp. SD176 TaxID=2983548 RepID=UPI0024DF87E6|nr:amino acid racemase [Rhabdaerophilum sp. SD176]